MAAACGLRRLFVASSPGLERCLERELQVLRIPGHLEVLAGGVQVHGKQESLWRIVLQSRVAESVRVQLGEPFHAPDERMLTQGLERIPWERCLDLRQSEFIAPNVRCTCARSRLYHTRLVEERVASAVQARATQLNLTAPAATDADGPAPLPGRAPNPTTWTFGAEGGSNSSSAEGRVVPQPAEIRVRLRHDECHVSVGASGPLHQRGYRKAVGDAPLRETLAAAAVLTSPLLRRLTAAEHSGEDLVVWDPFCGSGVLLLEALGLALGELPGTRNKRYPFAAFPEFDTQAYDAVAGALHPTQHPAIGRLRLLGSDVSETQVERAQRNLRRFLRRTDAAADPASGDAEWSGPERSLPCSVDFQNGSPSKLVRNLAGRPTMILTNVPYGVLSGARISKSGRTEALDAYNQLGRMLRQKVDWRGVFCIVANAEEFRQHTAAEWKSEMRFMNGGIWVDLLHWTGASKGTGAVSGGSGDRPANPRHGRVANAAGGGQADRRLRRSQS